MDPAPDHRTILFTPRILSGIQPAESIHLGHYFGAIQQQVAMQHEYPGECFYFLANCHSLTAIHDRERLRNQSAQTVLDYLALGIDPTKATFYRQSDVPQVFELMWILACLTPQGMLDRGHAFKDKIKRGLASSAGLWLYPVLMAADILALRTTIVPVGKDQKQNVEIARDLAARFNDLFDTVLFPLPEPRFSEASPMVPGTDGQKMSHIYGNTIPVFLPDEDLKKRILQVRTSSAVLGQPVDHENDPVFQLYRLAAGPEAAADLQPGYGVTTGYGEAKERLYVALKNHFAPFHEKRAELSRDRDAVEDLLRDGANRVREQVTETLERVREAVGLGAYSRAHQRGPLGGGGRQALHCEHGR